jgi:hypothetical protein
MKTFPEDQTPEAGKVVKKKKDLPLKKIFMRPQEPAQIIEVELLKAQLAEKIKKVNNQSEWLKKLQGELDYKGQSSTVDPQLSLLNKDSEINKSLSSVNDVQGELKKLREECEETKTELFAAEELLETQEDELTRSKLRVGQVKELAGDCM